MPKAKSKAKPKKVSAIPKGAHSIIASLTCKNASKAIDFYKTVFGAKEKMRMPTPDGRIAHAELLIGDSTIMLNDEMGMGEAAPSGPTGGYLYVYVPDADGAFNRAVTDGAKVTMAIANQFWGDRYGRITDPFGPSWGICTHVEDVSPKEMDKRAKEMFANFAKAAAQGA